MFTAEELANFGVLNALSVSVIGIAVVMLELGLLAVCITLIGKIISGFMGKKAKKSSPVNTDADTKPTGAPLPGNESQGQLEIVNTDEKTAAIIMALVSHESGIPLNRLIFKSIKKLDD